MDVADLGLCKELYELSGWENRVRLLYMGDAPNVPRYDLGYLLRKLPGGTNLVNNGEDYACWYQDGDGMSEVTDDYGTQADTPEDAVAKLAIELFKQGILTRENVSAIEVGTKKSISK